MALTADAQFHVLAVDDSLIDRKLIERLLKTSSYQVTAVDSGSKALELLGLRDGHSNSPSGSPSNQEIEVNLVITDYCMPGMTGYDLLKKIKTSPLKDIPVVIMSSENVPSRINRCLEEGAEEFFLKPVQLSDMAKLVPHMMKGKSREQQTQQQDPPQHQQNNHSDNTTVITTHSNSSNNSNSNSNKRKTMDEGLSPERSLSPERTRPRYTVAA